jgi:hypothetical protein
MTCVAQGGPYVVGSVVALKAMAVSARRRRLSGIGPLWSVAQPSGPDDEPAPSGQAAP